MSGRGIQFFLAGILGLLVLIAYPAPSTVGAAEILMAGVAGLFLLHIVVLRRRFIRLEDSGKVVGWCLLAHVLGWFLAGVVGVAGGVDAMTLGRSLLPQILFAPLALLGLSFVDSKDTRRVVAILMTAGVLHALYLLGLGIFAYAGAGSASDLVLSRITFLDPRTTMPLFLALAPFGLAAMVEGRWRGRALGLGALILALSGSLVTQTRAQILAVLVAVLVFGAVYVISRPKLSVVVAALVVVGLGGLTVAIVPPLKSLAMAVFERQSQVGDNARFSEEWMPALSQWDLRGGASPAVGIGLGVPIKDFSGDEKTYIHNQTIYTLVYSGVLGFVLIGSLYFGSFAVLLRRYWLDRTYVDLAAASCLASLFVYAQFFAVHKLFSFNFMVFLLVCLAMRGTSRSPESTETTLDGKDLVPAL